MLSTILNVRRMEKDINRELPVLCHASKTSKTTALDDVIVVL